jgi:hypothetical protein
MIAYIDPGSGSYFFQLVIGGVLGAAVAVKLFWRRVWAFLTGRRSRDRSTERSGGSPAHDAGTSDTSATGAAPRQG